ncbi:MAG: DNA helicase, partial [Deltaproteobacteria bacterium]|nr:DNA helicase [Deltaproteobacteria bacterium]
MKFAADFHIHSKFSRATAKNLDLEHLHISAQLKGITVLGTGDFTHPAWFSEIKEKLESTDNGLFKLKDHLAAPLDRTVPPICRRAVSLMQVSELSNIYKKHGKTRKNHNLVFLPDLETAEKFNSKLDKIGNIKSDGRPILGLDSRDLLEILLETTPEAYLVPAHIWTPWFSMLGSKAGFDSVKACFEDLTPHVFALETGLSSDPAMNRRVSFLDNLTLISNSDAHSPSKLGREANLFNMEPSFDGIRSALMDGDKRRFLGTIEFYPEEGKYHLDGHRKCRVRLWPETTLEQAGLCPVCEKPVTLGVLHRVEELADRKEGDQPKQTRPFYRRIPLVEVLSEIFRVGPATKTVEKAYWSLIEKLGPELDILQNLPLGALEDTGIPLFNEAIKRARQNSVHILPGYDG